MTGKSSSRRRLSESWGLATWIFATADRFAVAARARAPLSTRIKSRCGERGFRAVDRYARSILSNESSCYLAQRAPATAPALFAMFGVETANCGR